MVEQMPEFNAIGKEIFQLLEKTGQSVLQAIALHLKLDENYFDEYVIYGIPFFARFIIRPSPKNPKMPFVQQHMETLTSLRY